MYLIFVAYVIIWKSWKWKTHEICKQKIPQVVFNIMVGATRLERAASRSRTVRSTKLSYAPLNPHNAKVILSQSL